MWKFLFFWKFPKMEFSEINTNSLFKPLYLYNEMSYDKTTILYYYTTIEFGSIRLQ